MSDGWQFYVDRGGTFTDVVARDPAGTLHVQKLLSENADRYPDAALEAVRLALGGTLDPAQVEVLRMGTTVATNALLERRGARVGLLITAGLEDLLRIGTQERPDLFALKIDKPAPLPERVVGVDEEHDATGRVLRRLDPVALRAQLESLQAEGIEAIAIAFKHAHLQPRHELAAGALAHEVGFRHVALSHEAGGEIGLLARGDTACADAYLTPALAAYLERVAGALSSPGNGAGPLLRFMKSSGGLAAATDFSGKDAILSGPAGGVVGAQSVATKAGLERVIAFDMGGTSTDVSRIDLRQGLERVYERTIAGVRLQAPSLAVHTIAAGGGSRIGFDGRRLRVGPESAGADPGPVCYRREGGLLSVTDANAVSGRVQPAHFPACFGATGEEPLDALASRGAFEELLEQVQAAGGEAPASVEALAAGCVRIANEAMAGAIREISVAKGHDLADYALVSFGGAGAQHACAVAETLGVETVLVPERGGVLSAWGIGLAPLTESALQSFLLPLESSASEREAAFKALEKKGRKALMAQGVKPKGLHFQRSADLRYFGVDATITIPEPPPESTAGWEQTFARAHRKLYGFDRPGHAVEVKTIRVETIVERAKKRRPRRRKPALEALAPGEPVGTATIWFERLSPQGERALAAEETPIYLRANLVPGAAFQGPALVAEHGATVVVEPGWGARVDRDGQLFLERSQASAEAAVDPSVLEGLDADDREAFSELCRCLMEGVPALDADGWEAVLGQAEAMEIPPAAAEHLARACGDELGVTLPAASSATSDPLAGQDEDLCEAFSELCRCMLEGVPALDADGWEGLLAQAEAMDLERLVAEHLARICAAELGVVVPAASPLAGSDVDPDLLEAFDELCRCLLEGVPALDADGWDGLLEQADAMELPREVAVARAAATARELGVTLPAGAAPEVG
ncbi:MAG: hypothetical protein JKY65_22665, partial [Planctomycetes bacterium]|nr:hypothetical protein [Planctomycetota bacterium]